MNTDKTSSNSIQHFFKKNGALYLLLLPSFILVLLFAYKPMVGIIMAFKDYRNGDIFAAPWADPIFKHFLRFINGPNFSRLIGNTLVISLYGLLAGFPFPILIAVTLNQIRAKKFQRFYQTVSYLPHFISTIVMVALLLIWLNPDTGLWGNLYRLFSEPGATVPNPMGIAPAFSHIYVWSDVWQHTGWNSIIFFAALAGIDPTLYEAATVDGASRMQKIIYVDLPMLMPTAMILLILSAGGIMNLGFEKVFAMQNSLNITASQIVSTHIYETGLMGAIPQYSYSTAVNLFQTAINLVLLFIVNTASKKLSDNSLF